MKKLAILILASLLASMPLYAERDGKHSIFGGYGFDWQGEFDLMLFYGTLGYSRNVYYNGTPFGSTFDMSIDFPTHYTDGGISSAGLVGFKNYIDIDLKAMASFRCGFFEYSVGLGLGGRVLMTTSNTISAEILFALANRFSLDFPFSNYAGFVIGCDVDIDFASIDFMDSDRSGFIIPRLEVVPFLGISIYFHDDISPGLISRK